MPQCPVAGDANAAKPEILGFICAMHKCKRRMINGLISYRSECARLLRCHDKFLCIRSY